MLFYVLVKLYFALWKYEGNNTLYFLVTGIYIQLFNSFTAISLYAGTIIKLSILLKLHKMNDQV